MNTGVRQTHAARTALTVERLADGEVSRYLADVLRPGDTLERRGPMDGYLVWERSLGEPPLLVAGGSGVVPLLAMLRHHACADAATRACAGADAPFGAHLELGHDLSRLRTERVGPTGWAPNAGSPEELRT